MNQINQTDQKTILVAVTDIFFYTKVRDALMSKGYKIERARTQQDIAEKASSAAPSAFILNMVFVDGGMLHLRFKSPKVFKSKVSRPDDLRTL